MNEFSEKLLHILVVMCTFSIVFSKCLVHTEFHFIGMMAAHDNWEYNCVSVAL